MEAPKPVTVEYDYPEMKLDYSEKGKLQLSMVKLLIDLLEEFPEELGATATAPAPDNLFKVRPKGEAILLPE